MVVVMTSQVGVAVVSTNGSGLLSREPDPEELPPRDLEPDLDLGLCRSQLVLTAWTTFSTTGCRMRLSDLGVPRRDSLGLPPGVSSGVPVGVPFGVPLGVVFGDPLGLPDFKGWKYLLSILGVCLGVVLGVSLGVDSGVFLGVLGGGWGRLFSETFSVALSMDSSLTFIVLGPSADLDLLLLGLCLLLGTDVR